MMVFYLQFFAAYLSLDSLLLHFILSQPHTVSWYSLFSHSLMVYFILTQSHWTFYFHNLVVHYILTKPGGIFYPHKASWYI